jgi:hypothetical protein
MLLRSNCVFAGAARAHVIAGKVHDAVANHLLLQALHVLLLEECMMLLQRQGEKFLLKFHSSSSSQAHQGVTSESKRHFHSPIIKVGSADIFCPCTREVGSADIYFRLHERFRNEIVTFLTFFLRPPVKSYIKSNEHNF